MLYLCRNESVFECLCFAAFKTHAVAFSDWEKGSVHQANLKAENFLTRCSILEWQSQSQQMTQPLICAGEDVRAALDSILSGEEPSKKALPSMGCSIKWHPWRTRATHTQVSKVLQCLKFFQSAHIMSVASSVLVASIFFEIVFSCFAAVIQSVWKLALL